MSTLIVYESRNEIIITTKENEDRTIKEYFTCATRRCKDDYDRSEYPTNISIIANLYVRG